MEQATAVGTVNTGSHEISYCHGPDSGDVWYKVIDILGALGQRAHSASMATRKLPDNLKKTWLINGSPTLVVSGVGMVELIMRSRAKNADSLRGWAREWLDRTSGGSL